jgi:hypothetical protein
MTEKLEVKRGTKLEADEAQPAISTGKFALLMSKPPADEEVEGQYYYGGWTQCPWCGNVGWTRGLDSNFYETIVCGSCGRAFRA